MKTKSLLLLLYLSAQGSVAEQLILPSDDQMLRDGRKVIDRDLSSFDKATRPDSAPARLEPPLESVRLSPLAKQLANETFSADPRKLSQSSSSPELIVFVSFSMPDDVLSEYSKQAKEAGGVIVLRGMWNDSIKKTQQRAATVNQPLAQWDINPGLFRKFKVDRVPSIILAGAGGSQEQLTEDGCALPGSYLRIDGAISIRQALLLMRQRGEGRLAEVAAQRLAKLERQQ